MIPLYHVDRQGSNFRCGKRALYVKKFMDKLHELPADNVIRLDGKPVKPGDFVFCGSCGEPLSPYFLAYKP